LISQVRIHAYV